MRDGFKKASVTGRGRLRPRKTVFYLGHYGNEGPPFLESTLMNDRLGFFALDLARLRDFTGS